MRIGMKLFGALLGAAMLLVPLADSSAVGPDPGPDRRR